MPFSEAVAVFALRVYKQSRARAQDAASNAIDFRFVRSTVRSYSHSLGSRAPLTFHAGARMKKGGI